MKVTKEDLIKQNERLQVKADTMEAEDIRVRKVLSELLDSYEYKTSYGYSNSPEKTVKVRSWEGIAFLIGELKADADYSMCIEAREELKREVELWKKRVNDLENPLPITH